MILFKRYFINFFIEKIVFFVAISLSTQVIFAEEKSYIKDVAATASSTV